VNVSGSAGTKTRRFTGNVIAVWKGGDGSYRLKRQALMRGLLGQRLSGVGAVDDVRGEGREPAELRCLGQTVRSGVFSEQISEHQAMGEILMRTISFGITMMALWLASAGVASGAESFNQDRIVGMANRYISNKWPGFDLRKRKPSVVDLGARYRVSYPLPDCW